jgi:hypothetical protein
MDAPTLLTSILNSTSPAGLLSRRHYRQQYLGYLKLLHPDVCHLPGAGDAVARLNDYVAQLKALDQLTDDAGPLRRRDEQTFSFEGDPTLLGQSLNNYRRLTQLPGEAARHFRRYLPAEVRREGDALLVSGPEFLVPLSGLTLPAEHVAWVLSRLLEFTAWLHQEGFCHAGLHPEALALVPGTHGLLALSFYHLTSLGWPLTTVAGNYLSWYPPATFRDKRATPSLDLSLAQRTALYLLGDPSGHGVKLRKTVDERLINFLIAPQQNAYAALTEWRALLQTVFGKPVFHPLEL